MYHKGRYDTISEGGGDSEIVTLEIIWTAVSERDTCLWDYAGCQGPGITLGSSPRKLGDVLLPARNWHMTPPANARYCLQHLTAFSDCGDGVSQLPTRERGPK
jgi:hypothetical protein